MSMHTPIDDQTLLAECDVETFRSSGPGGQNVNKRDTAVRLVHRPTGLVVTCRQERSQYQNKQLALQRLRKKLQELSRRRRPRIPTKASRSARERTLAQKKRKGATKQLRRGPGGEE